MLPFNLPEVTPCLVAFSGGADSRLLLELTLRALLSRDGEAGRGQVMAAHLHHGIRGAEADRDLAFCEEVCRRLGVRLITERVDIPALAAATGESPETAARRARYDFLGRVMAAEGISVLMTAHHADDNLETVLAHLLRGSGTRGMAGIPALRPLTEWEPLSHTGFYGVVYRPLLAWTRRDILAACRDMGLDFVTDSTNGADGGTRNRIRREVIPALEAIAGEDIPQRAATRMSAALREDEDYLSHRAVRMVECTLSPYPHSLSAEDLKAHHPAISKRAVGLLYRNLLREGSSTEEPTLSAAHLEALLTLVDKSVPESSLHLPHGVVARIREGFLILSPAEEESDPAPPEAPVTLTEGDTPWGNVTLRLESSDSPLSPLEGAGVWASAVFPATLPLPLVARPRREGDLILSHGMHKKLKKLLCDKDIPPHLRARIPLLCLPDGAPLWYPAVAFRDGYPAPAEGPCLRVTVLLNSNRAQESIE